MNTAGRVSWVSVAIKLLQGLAALGLTHSACTSRVSFLTPLFPFVISVRFLRAHCNSSDFAFTAHSGFLCAWEAPPGGARAAD